MKKLLLLSAYLLFFLSVGFSQSYYFGVKGGPTLGFQQWDGFDRNVLIRYHGSAFIESASEPGEFALFAQAGYHEKGSTIGGGLATDALGNLRRLSGQAFVFRNIDLVLGVKQKMDFNFAGSSNSFYSFGIRGEYTIGTNLGDYQERFQSLYFPAPDFVEKWNYGASIGGGFEYKLSEYIGAVVELSLHPDFSFQYRRPPLRNVINPVSTGPRTINLREQTIRNVTFEISVGFKFLREIEYID